MTDDADASTILLYNHTGTLQGHFLCTSFYGANFSMPVHDECLAVVSEMILLLLLFS